MHSSEPLVTNSIKSSVLPFRASTYKNLHAHVYCIFESAPRGYAYTDCYLHVYQEVYLRLCGVAIVPACLFKCVTRVYPYVCSYVHPCVNPWAIHPHVHPTSVCVPLHMSVDVYAFTCPYACLCLCPSIRPYDYHMSSHLCPHIHEHVCPSVYLHV